MVMSQWNGRVLTILCLVLWCAWFDYTVACDNCTMIKPEPLSAIHRWEILEKKLKGQVDDMLRKVLPEVIRQSAEANISADCQGAIVRTTFALRQLKGWALKIVDSSGKPPAGMIEGTLSALGSHYECISTVAYQDEEKSVEMFRGKYCNLFIRPPVLQAHFPRNYDQALHFLAQAAKTGDILGPAIGEYAFLARDNAMRMGICVPSKCVEQDVENIANMIAKNFDFRASVPKCEMLEEQVVDTSQKVAIGLIAFIFGVMTLGTILDVAFIYGKEKSVFYSTKVSRIVTSVFLAFSVYTNTKKLLATNASNSSIQCLNGIRVFSMSWIILGHTYFFVRNSQIYKSLLNGYDFLMTNIFATPLINMTVAVDTFFFISGFLLIYSSWYKLEKDAGSMNYLTFIVKRYWRLTPSMCLVILMMLLFPLLGSGPFWHETVDDAFTNCRERWWINLLYFQNWINFKTMCMPVTWYLATNMQFYLISMIFLVPLFKYPRIGVALVVGVTVLGMAVTAIVTWIHDVPPGMLFLSNYDLLDLVLTKVYHKPYAHIGAFCVGVLSAFIFLKYQKAVIKPMHQVFGWLLAAFLTMSVLYGVYDWNRGKMPSTGISALYAATHRTAWALGVGWVIYMCATGRGGIVNTILSWKAFIPLANISYMAYLIHPIMLRYHSGTVQTPLYYSHYTLVYIFLGHFMVTMMFSVVAYLAVELPFSNLERMLFSGEKKSSVLTITTSTDQVPANKQETIQQRFIARL